MKRKKRKTRQLSFEWCCSYNDQSKMSCEYRNSFTEEHLIQYVKDELENFRSNKSGLEWNFDSYIQANIHQELDESKLAEIESQSKEIEELREANFKLYAKDIITDEEYANRNSKLQEQLQELLFEQNKYLQQEQEMRTAKLKFDTFVKYLDELDLDNLTNPVLRQLVSSIRVETRKRGLKQ